MSTESWAAVSPTLPPWDHDADVYSVCTPYMNVIVPTLFSRLLQRRAIGYLPGMYIRMCVYICLHGYPSRYQQADSRLFVLEGPNIQGTYLLCTEHAEVHFHITHKILDSLEKGSDCQFKVEEAILNMRSCTLYTESLHSALQFTPPAPHRTFLPPLETHWRRRLGILLLFFINGRNYVCF